MTGSFHTFFKMPKLRHVDASIHKACEYIMNSDLSLTPLNLEYLGHCPPSKEQRRELREKLGARFGPFQETEVAEIKQKFYSLLASINMSKSDAVMFCTNLENQVKDERRDEARHKRKWRKAGVRLILGSYLGQDLHTRLASFCFNQLIKTVLHKAPTSSKPAANSSETPQPSPEPEDPVMRKRTSEPAPGGSLKKRKLASSVELNNMFSETPAEQQMGDGSNELKTPVYNPHNPLPAKKETRKRNRLSLVLKKIILP